jgi:hypothetical protein
MTQQGNWASYVGRDAVILAIVLLITAGAIAFWGFRLHHPLEAKRPGKAATCFMIIIWLLSIFTFLINYLVYGIQIVQEHLVTPPIPNPISPVTYACVVITFVVILLITRKHGYKIALLSAFTGALAAPMIFELPFDLIIIRRTYPVIPPNPAIFRGLFFFPLFLIEISTISFLILSPLLKLSRYTLFALAGVFFIFAVWALFGFSYPFTPLPIALNMISKIMSFIVAITLFIPPKKKVSEKL